MVAKAQDRLNGYGIPFGGEPTCNIHRINQGSILLTSQLLLLSGFTAARSGTVTSVGTLTNGGAGATPTLCRIGVYERDPVDDGLTLIASTANDTTLWGSATTWWERDFSSTWEKGKGVDYAMAFLCVTAAAAGSLWGIDNAGAFTISAGRTNVAPLAPWMEAPMFISGQSDLPATISAADTATARTANTAGTPFSYLF